MTTANDRWFDLVETPEGRAYYPYGSWGAGYLVDARAERRLSAYLGRMLWLIAAFLVLPDLLRRGLVHLHMPVPFGVADIAGFVAFLAFHHSRQRAILRGCPRAAYRPSPQEMLRLRLAKRGRTTIVAAHWALLIIFGAFAVMFAVFFDGLERWLAAPAYAAVAIVVAASLRRVEQLSD